MIKLKSKKNITLKSGALINKSGLHPCFTKARMRRIERNGFSIGEVILSVFILGIILTSIMTMYNTGLKEIIDERDSVIASLLAQEGVELVRNIRDNNWAKGNPSSFSNIDDSSGCTIDATDAGDDDCQGNSYLLYNDGTLYSHDSSGDSTKFSRKIVIDDSDPEKREILSFVTWNASGNTPDIKDDCTLSNKCVFSESILTGWGS